MAHKKNMLNKATLPANYCVGIGWYTPHQWQLLKQVSADADQLDDSYEDWLRNSERLERELQEQGQPSERVMVDIESLVAWCKEHSRPINGAARAQYIAEQGRTNSTGKVL